MNRHGDELLSLSDATFSALERFLAERKFVADDFYPEPCCDVRESAEHLLNDLVVRVIAGIKESPTKGFFLTQLKPTLEAFSDFDSEEQDRLMEYLGRLLDILGIASTDGLIGAWRYGNLGVSANDN